MGLILDSSVVIGAERQGHTAYEMLEWIGRQSGDTEIAVSVVTVLELAHGLARADTVARRIGRQKFLDDLLIGMPVHPVTVPIALRAGQIDGELQATGVRVALADLPIGATAPMLGHAVATGNKRHFGIIPGLVVSPFLTFAMDDGRKVYFNEIEKMGREEKAAHKTL